MIEAHSVAAVRRAESVAMSELPSGALMQRAAGALAGVVVRELRERVGRVYGVRVCLLIGPGNNGADALYAGARLAARGVAVTAIITASKPHAEALDSLLASGGRVIDIVRQPAATPGADTVLSGANDEEAQQRRLNALRLEGAAGRNWMAARRAVLDADLVIDGLLGIGGRPGLGDSAARIVNALDPRVPVISVDVPSGINPDTGAVVGVHVTADVTVTFGTAKPGLLLPPGSHAAGRVEVVDIGLDAAYLGSSAVQRVSSREVAALWPVPRSSDDKYSRGVVGVVAGGGVYTGAAVLATGAAMRAGAGMVRFVGPDTVTRAVRQRWPEIVTGEGRVQAWVLGPGVDPDSDDDQAKAIQTALLGDVPCVVDAGGIDILARVLTEQPEGERVPAPMLLTPHAGELARLLQVLSTRKRVTREAVLAAPLEFAREAAEITGATVLLKGAVTIVVDPEGTVRSQDEAPAWLATAGAGDVLSGIAGTLLASGLAPVEAGSLAAWLHGSAATQASQGGPITAEDVLDAVPRAAARLLTSA
ncbi:MAG: bifunctional ADP-dependent NAD(P)H-hydrate dehydratase/NAD(P)H-hydrate epimerase [Actinomycetales bacterium]